MTVSASNLRAPAPSYRVTYSDRNLHGQVVLELGRRVVSGNYPAGALLPNEAHLYTELHVSRTALREAVKVLSAKGLLEARPRIGTRVRAREQWNLLDPDVLAWCCSTSADAKFLGYLNELREIMEPAAAGLAARSRSEEQLATLAAALASMHNARTMAQWVEADLAFHTAVLHATNNPLMIPLTVVISSALAVLLRVAARSTHDFKRALPDHHKVFDAIRNHDAPSATHRMAAMLSETRALINQRML
jgi:DNA-binding FadR family transcriptional regulator